MKAKDLLSQLSRMEQSLHDFSFEELTSTEATELKDTFEMFRKNLENKVFQPSASRPFENSSDFPENSKQSKEIKSETIDSNMLIAKVSHEIRTPLNGIIGFTDLLQEDDELNPKQLEQVSAIQKASYSLMEIINELLEYSKLSAGAEAFEMVDFNFRNVVGDVIYLCKTLVSEKDVHLNVEIDKNIPEILFGDPSKLTQVLLNLVGNAIKFVEKGSIHLGVQIKSNRGNRTSLTFTIADTGIGISKENLKHIFNSFAQAETSTYAKYGGSGLGLSIVKQIIEQLGGNISVISELGVGTTFKFFMPFEVGNLDALIKASNTNFEITSKERDAVRGMSILIFEDNILNQRLIDQRLKSWGCKTYITDDAEYGLRILANHKIDLVFMDLKMPRMNGFEIAELIRNFEKPGVQALPIVALSADFSAEDKERCDNSGIDDFILKPFNSDELLLKIIENKKDTVARFSIKSENPPVNVQKEEIIDLSQPFEECMGQVEFLEELMVLHKQNILEFIGNVLLHLKHSDFDQISMAAHKIKFGLKWMQSNSLVRIVEQIQKCCDTDQDIKQLKLLYNSFLVEYPKTENAIDGAIKEFKKSQG